MYLVKIFNGDTETIIHSPYVSPLKLTKGVIKEEINKISTFDLSFLPGNPAFGKMRPFSTLIEVYNLKRGEAEFEGRVLSPNTDMSESGLIDYSFLCESELGYLHDAQQRHLEFRGTVEELLETHLDYFNSQVEPYKRFQVGEVTVKDPNDNVYVYLNAEETTFDSIQRTLVNRYGGELRIRKVNGVRYLDYLIEIGEVKSTQIHLEKNLMSMSVSVDPREIVTRFTPLGSRIESDNPDATDASEARITIESVNGGLPYIDNAALISEFGIQGGSETWDDVKEPSILLSKGKNWMDNQKVSHNQYQINALDLSLVGIDPESIYTGNSYPVINPIMNIDNLLRVVGKELDINSPETADYTFGDKFKTLVQYQNDANRASKQIFDLEGRIQSQSNTISILKNEINSVNQAMIDIEGAINEADLPALGSAINNLNQTVDDLNEAIQNISIPLVTQTSDGAMSSIDKIKLDNLKNYSNATEDSDGLMDSADKIKLNKISVEQAIDLDDLLNRVVALEGGI